MPKLPTHDSQRQLIINQPQFLRGGRRESEVYDIAARTLSQVAKITTQWKNALDAIQFTTAKSNFSQGLVDILNRAENDSEYNNSEQYIKEIGKLKESSLKGFSNKAAEQKAALDFDLQSLIAGIKIEKIYKKKAIEVGLLNLDSGIEALQQKRISSVSATEYQQTTQEINDLIDLNVHNGIITSKSAGKLKVNSVIAGAEYAILNNPKAAKQELQKGDEGLYKNIPLNKRMDLIWSAEIREDQIIKQRKEAIAFATNQREAELIDMKIDGTLNETIVREDMEAGIIDDKFAEAMISNMRSPKRIGATTEDRAFNRLAEMMVDVTKKPADIRLELLQKNATGELSDEDFQTLNTFNQTITTEIVDKAMPKKTWLQRLFNNSKDQGMRQEIIANMFKQYMKKVNADEDPAQAVNDVISLALDRHLVEQLDKPNRQYAINPETKQRIYSDDGGATWIDEKTGKFIK